MQKYKIDKNSLEFIVFFIHDFVDLDGENEQLVTTCGLRIGRSCITYWGSTIENPHDCFSQTRGRQVAFRRAFLNYLRNRYGYQFSEDVFPNENAKELYNYLRKELYKVRAW